MRIYSVSLILRGIGLTEKITEVAVLVLSVEAMLPFECKFFEHRPDMPTGETDK